MNDGHAILQAVKQETDADAHRLVYADWLEDNGDPLRAEFIRLQVQLAAYEVPMTPPDERGPSGPAGYVAYTAGGVFYSDARAEALCQRQEHLLAAHGHRWSGWGGARVVRLSAPGEEEEWGPPCSFRRGFVEGVRCPVQEWLHYGGGVCRLHPVRRVRRTDRYGNPSPTGWFCSLTWSMDRINREDGDLPPAVWDLLRGHAHIDDDWKWYDSEEAATDALSAALLRHAGGL